MLNIRPISYCRSEEHSDLLYCALREASREAEKEIELEGVRGSDREREIEKGLKRERVRENRGERGEKDRQKIRITQCDIEVEPNTI